MVRGHHAFFIKALEIDFDVRHRMLEPLRSALFTRLVAFIDSGGLGLRHRRLRLAPWLLGFGRSRRLDGRKLCPGLFQLIQPFNGFLNKAHVWLLVKPA